MLNIKATILLGAPLLAAASDILPTRIQRRHALLDLLQHHREKRAENYGVQDICTATPGANEATFTQVPTGTTLAGPLSSYTYSGVEATCVTLGSCQNACITDGSECFGINFSDDTGVCQLLGENYSGGQVSVAGSGTYFIANAGTTTASTGSSSGESVPTCATSGTLDTQAVNGACTCGVGRHQASVYTCGADPVPAGSIAADQQPITLVAPVQFTSPITWDSAETGVPAVLTTDQCAVICTEDSGCQAFLLVPGEQLSECWKIGADGVYDSPAGFPFVATSAARVKRATGQAGLVGAAGDIFGQLATSTLANNAYAAAPGASAAAARRMRVKRVNSQVQW